jgi:hypothetical protein
MLRFMWQEDTGLLLQFWPAAFKSHEREYERSDFYSNQYPVRPSLFGGLLSAIPPGLVYRDVAVFVARCIQIPRARV